MEDNVLEIQLLPSFISTAKSMYDEEEIETGDIDSEAVSFQQGVNISMMPVEPGEEFKISIEFESGSISCEHMQYKLIKKVFSNDKEKKVIAETEDEIILDPGKYFFHTDGITIEEIGDIYSLDAEE